ncbi:CBS domain-containing protein [Gephyromycinifex aptenodytis]|uniref:CBS domain-containing protein n=1 Tax=Gephyromycinifex aptenodytis TaxID=2716227 RepID=UPI001447E99A|nr:CBS domain-containing protein [Gephyromycinifex aptenodytis]
MPTGEPSPVKTFNRDASEKSVQNINEFLALVKKGCPWSISTKDFLRLNGNKRRGSQVNAEIQSLLRQHELVSTPAIEKADYYGSIVISDPRDTLPGRDAVGAIAISAFQGDDSTLIYAGREMPATKVETLMIKDNYSQIPVLSHDQKTLHGVVTWRSLARYRGDRTAAKAGDVVQQEGGVHVAASSDDFLGLVATIIEKEFILYRDPQGVITGIVTSSDLAEAFNDLSGHYIKVWEIEDRLRLLLDRAPIPMLKKHLDPKFGAKANFRGATDMMFGEYLTALEDKEVWELSGINLDQNTCLKLLKAVKDARNRVMHFNSEMPDAMRSSIEQLLRILRSTPLS